MDLPANGAFSVGARTTVPDGFVRHFRTGVNGIGSLLEGLFRVGFEIEFGFFLGVENGCVCVGIVCAR
jgi:hypothetical protein